MRLRAARGGRRRGAGEGPDEGTAPRWRSAWIGGLHVFVVVSFAVAQPLYELLAAQAEFFVFQNAGRAEILGLVAVLGVGLPLGLVVAARLAGLIAGPGAERRVHEAVVAAGVVLDRARRAPVRRGRTGRRPRVRGAGARGSRSRCSTRASGPVRLFFTLLAPGVVVFPAMFLAASPVTPLLAQEARARELALGDDREAGPDRLRGLRRVSDHVADGRGGADRRRAVSELRGAGP